MRNKLCYIGELLHEHSLSILCITETWLYETELPVIEAALPATYTLLHCPRSNGARGGGVGVIHHRSVSGVKVMSAGGNATSFESITVAFSHKKKPIKLTVVYRPGHPGTDPQFIEDFGIHIEWLQSLPGTFIITGDFNYWIDTPHLKPYSREFLELLERYNCSNHVSGPTHIAGHTLDLLITDSSTSCLSPVTVFPIDINLSDHAIISFALNLPKVSSLKRVIEFRNYSNINQNAISKWISSKISTFDLSASPEDLVDEYNAMFSAMVDQYFPLIKKTISVRDDGDWFDSSIAELRKARRRAERLWRRLRTESSRNSYVEARRAVVSRVKELKRMHYRSKISACDGNQQVMWRILNKLLGTKASAPLPLNLDNIANKFADFFESRIEDLREELDSLPLNEFSINCRSIANDLGEQRLLQFSLISVSDTLRYVKKLNKTFCLLDPVDVSKILPEFECAAPFITAIINKCFDQGVFPLSEKRAIVRPLLKKATLDREVLSNYRPVSNLSFLSKILEHAILDQLEPHLVKNLIIPQFQSAYRKQHSTETALCRVQNDLVRNVCSGSSSILLLLDLSAAFDTVDHSLLLRDLAGYGIGGPVLSLIGGYLVERSQRVIINNTLSDTKILKHGVPQGSVLGPILFLIYTASLASILHAHGVAFHFYADDTQIYLPITSIENVKNKLVMLLSDIRVWMVKRKLKLNEGKTELILIRGNNRYKINDEFGTFDFNLHLLTPASSVRNIGVFFDETLSFEKHINYVVSRCNYYIRNMFCIREFLDRKSLVTLVHSLVMSHLDYCNSVFYGVPNKFLRRMQSVLNRAARLIFGLPPRCSTTAYLIKLHWLPIKARIEFKICLMVFKILKSQEPKYLYDLLKPYTSDTEMRLRIADDTYRLEEPRASGGRSFFTHSFSYCAPRLFNSLPLSFKECSTIDCFKSKLKTFLFERAYDIPRLAVTEDYRV